MSDLGAALARERIPAIDGLRAVGVLMLVVGHWGRNQPGVGLRGLEPLAGLGVVLLLVVTGFVATIKILRDLESGTRDTAGGWLSRKALRTYPTLVMVVLAATLVQQLVNGRSVPVERYVGFWSLFGNYYYALAQADLYRHALGHLWSLMVGAHFLVPWFFIVRRAHPVGRLRALGAGAAALFLLSSVVRIGYGYSDSIPGAYAYLATEARLADILVGAWFGLIAWTVRGEATWMTSPVSGIASATVLGVTFAVGSPLLVPVQLLAIAHAVFWLVSRNANGVARALELPPLALVSTISYSVFAWHLYGLQAEQLVAAAPWPVRGVIAMALTLTLCGAASLVLEWPVRRWLRRAHARRLHSLSRLV